MTNHLRLRLFGGFQLEGPGGEPISMPLRKGEALLAYLAVSLGRTVSRERLAALLWGDSEQHRARQSLRQVLFALSREFARLEVSGLSMGNQTVGLDESAVWVDAIEFERLVETGTPEALARAAALYRGEFLAGLHVEAEDFEDWRAAAQDRYQRLAMKGMLDLLAHQEASGEIETAIETANRALRADPFREDIHRRLMLLYIAKGMRSSALAQYRSCRETLERELGVAPDTETEGLYRRILDQYPCSPSQVGQDGPAAASGIASAAGRPADVPGLIAQLSEAARGLARVAGVAGPRADHRVLAAAAGLDEAAALGAMEELVGVGLCVLEGEELAFTDPSAGAALSETLLPPRHRSLHAALAAAIGRVQGGQIEPHLDRMAHHLREAGRETEALAFALGAAAVDLDRGNRGAARERFRRILAAANGLEDPAAASAEIEARLGLVAGAEAERDLPAASKELELLEERLEGIDDPGQRAAALHALARIACLSGDKRSAWGHARRALAESGRPGRLGPWLPADDLFARAHLVLDAGGRGVDRLRRLQRRARRLDLLGENAAATAALALVQAARGDFGEALDGAHEAIGLAEALGDERSLAAGLQILAMIETWRGAGEAALACLDKATDIARTRGDLPRLYALGGHRGHALLAAGRTDEARAALRHAEKTAGRLGDRALLPYFLAWLAEAALEAGDEEEALNAGREAFRLAAEANQPWPRSIALRALARILAHPSMRDLHGAEKAIRSALAEQEGLGLEAERARSLLIAAKIQRARGDLPHAAETYGAAAERFREMALERDFEQARTMAEALRPSGMSRRSGVTCAPRHAGRKA